ncbi:MAG: hypothetical protein M3P33_02590, partial [bacterium]|nr:hypothetical protein [bacterium]
DWGFNVAPNGRVLVNPSLQVPSHQEIYVAGDGAQLKGSGQAWPALEQGVLVAKNIYNQLGHHPQVSWDPIEPLMIVPVGYDWAITQLHGKFYTGSAGNLLHELYNLKFYNRLLPMSTTWSIFKSGGEMCHSCHVCLHNHKQKLTSEK